MKLAKPLAWLPIVILVICYTTICLKSMIEPDLWWILRTGDWILANGKVPTEDVFSFTFAGTEWINVKWLFEVITSIWAKAFGVENLPLIQIVVNGILLLALWKITKIIGQLIGKEADKTLFALIAIAAIPALDFRMNARPEMISHLFTMLFLWIVLKQRQSASRWIFALIPLQMLWTNLHEAYGIGIVLNLILLGSVLWENSFSWENLKKQKTLLLASGLSIASVVVNPRGMRMIWHPFEIYSQLDANKFTSELLSYTAPYYWKLVPSWFMVIFAAIGLWFWLRTVPFIGFVRKKIQLKKDHPVGSFYLLVLLAFTWLSLSANRNIPFLITIAMPLVIMVFQAAIQSFGTKLKLNAAIAPVLVFLLGIGMYYSIASGNLLKWTDGRTDMGLSVPASKNPVATANFLIENKVEGNGFSDYLTSSYLMWAMKDDFKSFIDLRDLDVFTVDFFQKFSELMVFPEKFDSLDNTYNFDYAVIYRPQFAGLHKFIANKSNWFLVHADPVATVYVKDNGKNAALLTTEIRNRTQNVFTGEGSSQRNKLAQAVNSSLLAFAPEIEQLNKNVVASTFYRSIGYYDLSLKSAATCIGSEQKQPECFESAGFTWLQMGDLSTNNDSLRQEYYESAGEAFRLGLEYFPKDLACKKGLAFYLMRKNDIASAETQLQQVAKLEENPSQTYQLLAEVQSTYMQLYPNQQATYMQRWFSYLEKAHEANKDDIALAIRLGLAYCQTGNCKKSAQYLKGIEGYPGLSNQEYQMLQNCRSKCNVE